MCSTSKPHFWIGPAGWSYADWNGIVYPQGRQRGFKPLEFIGRLFNAVEVNSSFYRTPTPQMTQKWPAQVPENFRFAFKLSQKFTHRRDEFPPRPDVDRYKAALAPVRATGKLGPILVQFPWSFRYSATATEWLRRISAAFDDYDRFIEVRHTSWLAPEAGAALREAGGMCVIDQPLLRDCLPPTEHVTARRAYVRLHGRNREHWFAQNQPGYQRYNYLYTPKEIDEWVARLRAMATQAHEAYVFANNHFEGKGVANALELAALLAGQPRHVPPRLLSTYPQLQRVALPPEEPTLF